MSEASRRSIGFAAVVATTAIVAAVWSWTAQSEQATSLPVVESHGLDPDQAACFGYGLVIRHSETVDLTLDLGKYQGLDPGAGGELNREIDAIDRVTREHPLADARLASAFDEVAAEGEAVVASNDILGYREAVTGRSAEIAESRETCLEVADFDVETLSIGKSGLP